MPATPTSPLPPCSPIERLVPPEIARAIGLQMTPSDILHIRRCSRAMRSLFAFIHDASYAAAHLRSLESFHDTPFRSLPPSYPLAMVSVKGFTRATLQTLLLGDYREDSGTWLHPHRTLDWAMGFLLAALDTGVVELGNPDHFKLAKELAVELDADVLLDRILAAQDGPDVIESLDRAALLAGKRGSARVLRFFLAHPLRRRWCHSLPPLPPSPTWPSPPLSDPPYLPRDPNGLTPLHHAAWSGHAPCVRLLLHPCRDPAAASVPENQGWTPLHIAAENNHAVVCTALLHAGADPHARNRYAETPLHRAARNGCDDAVVALLAGGAVVDAPDRWRQTPLHRAARNGHVGVVERLRDAGADTWRRTFDGMTPLHRAAAYGHPEVVKALLRGCAHPPPKDHAAHLPASPGAETPLHVARGDAAVPLLEWLADVCPGVTCVEARTADGKTALVAAARDGSVEVVRALLKAGAEIGARDGEGRTALEVAALGGHGEVFSLLQEMMAGRDTHLP
ncbi:hypothetical protein HDU96_005129 [Phlyctochytrium bullatum]|nr:hypothetical protein HDU96_005129 [Phlyctochytrium bullatum]